MLVADTVITAVQPVCGRCQRTIDDVKVSPVEHD